MVVQDLLAAARTRDKASIGLPPDHEDESASMAFFVGTRSDFAANPVKFDEVIHTGETMSGLPGATDQMLGVIDDQMVLQITVPDLPGAADLVDEVADAAAISVIIGTWYLSRHWKKIAINRVVLHLQRLRLAKAKRVAAAFGTGDKVRLRATIKSANIGRAIAKRQTKQVSLLTKTKRVTFVGTRIGAKVLFKVVGVVGLVIDVILVTHRVFKGAERAGIPGAEAAFVAGVADVLTLGLAEKQTDALEVKAETFFTKLGEAAAFIGRLRFAR